MPDLEQAAEALERANRVRTALAELKDDIHADPTWRTLAAVLRGAGPPVGERLTVMAAMDAAPGMGPHKVKVLTRRVLRAPSSALVGALTTRQREVLAFRCLARWGQLDHAALERIAAKPRDYRRERAWLERRKETAA